MLLMLIFALVHLVLIFRSYYQSQNILAAAYFKYPSKYFPYISFKTVWVKLSTFLQSVFYISGHMERPISFQRLNFLLERQLTVNLASWLLWWNTWVVSHSSKFYLLEFSCSAEMCICWFSSKKRGGGILENQVTNILGAVNFDTFFKIL